MSKVRIGVFTLTSHNFMSRDEIDTSLGRERLNACAFRVPVGSRMIPMCEAIRNAGERAKLRYQKYDWSLNSAQ